MADTKNLYQRLIAITEEVGKIEKTGKNTLQNYSFIEQAQVIAELRPQLIKHGVMIVPEIVSRKVESHNVTRGNGKPGIDVHVTVVSRYTLINIDNPDDRLVCEWDGGEAIDSSDKATNKAVTASDKSYLMKLFKISDRDDPDADSPPPPPPKPPIKYITGPQMAEILAIAKEYGYTDKAGAMKAVTDILGVGLGMIPVGRFDEAKATLRTSLMDLAASKSIEADPDDPWSRLE